MTDATMMISVKRKLHKGDMVKWTATENDVTSPMPLPALRIGDLMQLGEARCFQVVSVGWQAVLDTGPCPKEYTLHVLQDVEPQQDVEFAITCPGFTLAWITLSDKGAAGLREDSSGPLLAELVGGSVDLRFVQGYVIPDESAQLRALLTRLALEQGFDLIVTTGGTGVAPRDITPEATLAVIEKRLPGYERAMTAASLEKTPHGAISRAVAGTLGTALIVNMPGSPKAVRECLDPLLPTFKHTLEKLQGDRSDCAALYL